MMRRGLTLASLLVAATAIACIDITVDTKALGSVEVVSKRDSVVVAGDTLRDTSGAISPLKVQVYNAGGDVIQPRSVQFVAVDTVRLVATDSPRSRVTISPTGVVVARAGTTGQAKMYVVVDSTLQSTPQTVTVVPKPDSLVLSTAARDTINYRTLATNPFDTSGPATFHIATSSTTSVQNWLITFFLQKASDGTAVDTSLFAITIDTAVSRPTARTDGSGNVTRQVRFKGIPGTTLIDSVYLIAHARYKGAELPGSPKRVFILVKPAPPTQ